MIWNWWFISEHSQLVAFMFRTEKNGILRNKWVMDQGGISCNYITFIWDEVMRLGFWELEGGNLLRVRRMEGVASSDGVMRMIKHSQTQQWELELRSIYLWEGSCVHLLQLSPRHSHFISWRASSGGLFTNENEFCGKIYKTILVWPWWWCPLEGFTGRP